MTRSSKEERFPEDLQWAADMLRDQRPSLDPLKLDQIKLRAMRRATSDSSRHRGLSMRSRLTTLLAAGFLVIGTGGAFALDGGLGGGGKHGGSASFNQYCQGKSGKNCEEHGKTKGKGH